jgi:nitroreductase
MTEFDLAQADRLLKTTKQVRKRLDLTRPVPREILLDCIDVASHAPQGGNIQHNRWLVIDDKAIMEKIAPLYQSIGRPYLEANAANTDAADVTQNRVLESATYLVDHIAEVPAMVLAMRLGTVPSDAGNLGAAGFHGSVSPGVWSFQLAARARGIGSAWTTFHLAHEREIGDMLGIPESVTQIALLPCGYYTGDSFSPAKRRPAREITYFNQWKQTD